MRYQTKGMCCQNCGHEQNVTAAECALRALCPRCGVWVTLGQALGLTPGQALVAAFILWGLFG